MASGEWPTPRFNFEVRWGDLTMSFTEVSGLDVEAQPIEYRRGDSPQFSVTKMPGLKKYSDITMKRGVALAGDAFQRWFAAIGTGAPKRETVVINLLDETGAPTMTWTLTNAWPTKITGPSWTAGGNEVAVESVTLAHEGLTIENR